MTADPALRDKLVFTLFRASGFAPEEALGPFSPRSKIGLAWATAQLHADAILSSGLVVPAAQADAKAKADLAAWADAIVYASSLRKERDAAHAAIREIIEAWDAWDDEEGAASFCGRINGLRAIVPPVAAPIEEEAGDA